MRNYSKAVTVLYHYFNVEVISRAELKRRIEIGYYWKRNRKARS